MDILLFFIVVVILANVFDSKKKTAKRMPEPTVEPVPQPMPQPRRRPELQVQVEVPAEYNSYNEYQRYLEQHEAKNREAYDTKCDQPYDLSHKEHAHYQKGYGLPTGDKVTLAQAIVLGEILGKPKAKQPKRRYMR